MVIYWRNVLSRSPLLGWCRLSNGHVLIYLQLKDLYLKSCQENLVFLKNLRNFSLWLFQLCLLEYVLSCFFLGFGVFHFLNWDFCLIYVELYRPKLIHEVSYFHFSFWVYKECRLRHHFLSNSFGREDKEESDVIASIQSDMMCGRHESNVLILLYHLV